MQKIIIIRGNSGSGKTTIARRIRDELSQKVMFLEQDVLRRDMLRLKDNERDSVSALIEYLAGYAKDNGYDVVLDGILSHGKYGEMLNNLIKSFGISYVYYLDIPFDETLRRHNTRQKRNDFGEAEMREWRREKDYLGVSHEVILGEGLSEDELVARILIGVRRSDNL